MIQAEYLPVIVNRARKLSSSRNSIVTIEYKKRIEINCKSGDTSEGERRAFGGGETKECCLLARVEYMALERCTDCEEIFIHAHDPSVFDSRSLQQGLERVGERESAFTGLVLREIHPALAEGAAALSGMMMLP